MQIKKIVGSRALTVVAAAAVVGLIGAGAGYSAGEITSKDIKDETIKIKDIKPSTVTKLKGQTGATGPAGPAGPAGTSGTATYAGPNWSIIDRNVEENGHAYLRSGPGTVPSGVGSLGLQTGDPTDKAAFGDQVDFAGTTLATYNTLKYSVYTTGENVANGADNGPSLSLEIDPSGPTNTAGLNFSSLVWVPQGLTANAWTEQNASTGARWFLTGQAGTTSSCNQTTYCTLAQVKTAFPTATLFTVQITKGRDFEFSGAVDKLVVNADTYDFEPFGVTKK